MIKPPFSCVYSMCVTVCFNNASTTEGIKKQAGDMPVVLPGN